MQGPSKADAAFKLLQEQNYAGARAAYLALVAREPHRGEFRIGLASCLYRLGQHAAAVFHAEHALTLTADHERLTCDAATLLAKAGKPQEAIAHLVKVCGANTGWAWARATLGLLYEGDDKLDDAERVLLESLALDETIVWPRVGLANLLANQGRADEALVGFEYLTEHFAPEFPNASRK